MVNKISGSDAILKVIESWGVDHIYGYPGGSFDSTMNALHNQKDKMKFIQVRHEEAGALAASAEAKLTGRIGVCFGSAGPGGIHLLNGLYDARHDHAPVLAIVGQVPTASINRDMFQAMDEEPAFLDVACWAKTATNAQNLPELVDEGIRHAYKYHGVAVLVLPKDLGWDLIDDTYTSSARDYSEPIYPNPDPTKVEEAIEMIKKAKSPIIYFGLGAKKAAAELKTVSEKFKMPLVSSYLGKGILPDSYPAYMGTTGRVANKSAFDVAFGADLLLWVGNDSPFSRALFNPAAKVIQIDIDSEKIGKRHPVEVALLADAKKTLAAIAAKGEETKSSAFYDAALLDNENWRKWEASFNEDQSVPLRPEPVFNVINQTVSDKAIFAVDVGNVNIDFERLVNLHGDQKWTTSGQYATMGYGLPAAIAAKVAYPDRDVYSLNGDGAFAMLMEEILVQVKYHLHIVNIIFSNETLGFIEAEQRDDTNQAMSGIDIIPTNWAMSCEGLGAKSYTAKTLDEFKNAMAAAKNDDGPVVIDVKFTHEMPFTTVYMFLDPETQPQAKVDEFIKKYQAQDLKPFTHFLKEAGFANPEDVYRPKDGFWTTHRDILGNSETMP
ncbi:pyruvate oxidase [Xylocopilactobacillus apicola]|uniref:Pyruvate oxidase n=1 Tax=Xylocopilactobacillus apicola TaxID=2932184 RepID=A0AAU9DLR0_9LACO|nr:pyruvate oxidase [Xylocopilactobacillus apicola]BDR57837.1 pyruvate oxidase [Xylocopilactobacillus apicola]